MARIARDEYPTIQHLVNVEGRKVVEVAASYGCTPANIYAILGKARRLAGEAGTQPNLTSPATQGPAAAEAPAVAPVIAAAASIQASPADLFADLPGDAAPPQGASARTDEVPTSGGQSTAVGPTPVVEVPAPETRAPERVAAAPPPAPASAPSGPAGREASAASRAPRGAARNGKGRGIALLMRTSDGEETTHPFRSLEELLSASKPILRSAARSSEPIWFSIQEADLDALAADDF
jgi:hypothetical protein